MGEVVAITTYGAYNEEVDRNNEIEFVLPKEILDKLVKEEGWNDVEEFLNEYIYDNSLPIYERAKELNAIIKEQEF